MRDEIRPAAKRVIDFLKRSGLSVALLTGDRPGPAAMVAEQVGINDVRAELSPQAKLQCIHDWRASGKKVAMVGDGINDAPSLTPLMCRSAWARADPMLRWNRPTSF